MSRTDRDGEVASPTVTVLMPVYNGERFLQQQIDTILAQEGVDLRLICLDDASTDSSMAVLRSAALEDDRVTVHMNETNLGLIGTLSRLLAMVDGEYFSLADQDDVWSPQKLRTSIDHLKTTKAELVYSDVRVINERGELLDASYLRSRRMRPLTGRNALAWLYHNSTIGHTIVGPAWVAATATPVPPDLTFHEVWLIAVATGRGPVVFIDEQLGDYRLHSTNVIGARPPASALRARLNRLPRRDRTRTAALQALAIREPRLKVLAAAYSHKGLRRIPYLPAVFWSLINLRHEIGARAAAGEVLAFTWTSLTWRERHISRNR